MRIATLGKKLAISLQAMTLLLGMGTATVAGVVVSAAPAYALPSDCATGDPVNASDPLKAGAACSQGPSQKENLFGSNGIFTVAANTLIFLVGAISVIYLIIGGLRYVVSNGDSKAVTAAKDTILYAIVGVVVAVISFALIQFVINALNKAS
jgi:hypothetical protein